MVTSEQEIHKAPVISVVTIEQIPAIVKNLSPKTYCLDIETTGLNPRTEKIVSLQFGSEKRVCILDCRPFNTLVAEKKEHWITVLKSLINALCSVQVVGHNLKFDALWIKTKFEIELQNIADTMLQEQLIHSVGLGKAESGNMPVNLYATGKRYGIEVTKEQRSWFIQLDKRADWNKPFPSEQVAYMAQDILVPLEINRFQTEKLNELGLRNVADLENMCLPSIVAMESNGCKIEVEKWKAIIDRYTTKRDSLEEVLKAELTPYIQEYRDHVYQQYLDELNQWETSYASFLNQLQNDFKTLVKENALAGKWETFKREKVKEWKCDHPKPKSCKHDQSPINLGSHVQLKIALKALGISTQSTSKGSLVDFKKDFEIIGTLLEWKALEKFLTSFGEKLLSKVELDGRIYPSYAQIGAATGRMSSSSPNWQQIPANMKGDDNPRKCIVPENGHKLIRADLPNIELRILAELSQDEIMLGLFADGKDLHSATACNMFELPHTEEDYDSVARTMSPYGKKYRDIAKVINFGLVYGMSAMGLAHTLGVPLSTANEAMETYFATYPQVKDYLDRSSRHAVRVGYSTTVGGRKRFYSKMEEPEYDHTLMEWEEYLAARSFFYKWNGVYSRRAKNAPIQGTNADILKYALILLHRSLPSEIRIVTCVHDEVILESPTDLAEKAASILSKCMYRACRKYLKRVTIPEIDTAIADYWCKD